MRTLIGHTPAGTAVTLVRKNSKGVAGTKDNIEHHARALAPVVAILELAVQHVPFREWIQGHNVHTFITHDGRQYRFRPLYANGRPLGLELRQIHAGGRCSVLLQLVEPSDVPLVVQTLTLLARPQVKNTYRPIQHIELAA